MCYCLWLGSGICPPRTIPLGPEFDDNHKQLSINAVAKSIGERYEGVYRLEHGGGTSTVLVKYLLFIKQHDPKFDLNSRIKEIMGQKYPKY